MRSPPPKLGLWAALLAAAALLAVGGGSAAAAAGTEEAYVTLLYGDEFVLGVRVLGKSIRDAGTRRDLVVLISDGVSEYSRKLLEADGFIVKHIPLLANPNQVRPTRFWGVYTKLKIFNMTSYKKVVYLDADTIVVKSIEDLFKCGKFCANLKHSERMNSGVMVVEPSETLFKDMMDKVDSLPSYTGGDQGFLNSYYADFANSRVYEPNNPSTPEPEIQRLSTLYNADVGLYMLANKWMVDEKELRVIHYTLGPLKPWDWWTAWLVKPVAVWQNIRQNLEESLPGTAGGRNPHDQLVVNILFILPFCMLLCGYYGSCFQTNKELLSIRSLCAFARRARHKYKSEEQLPSYSTVGAASSSFSISNQKLSNGAHLKLPCYFGAITVLVCFISAVISLAFAFIIIPRQVMPWTGLLLMYEWTFVTFFLLFGSYLRFVYKWGSSSANHVEYSNLDSSENHAGTGHQRNTSDCDKDAAFYWTGMAVISIIALLSPTVLGITALFSKLGLMVAGGVVLASFMTYASEHLAISAFVKGRRDRNVPRDPISLVRDDKIKNELSALGISIQSFNGDLLYEPWEVYDENGHAFTTFNMYWEKCMKLPIETSPSLAPWRLVPVPGTENVRSCSIDDLGLESSKDEESSNALLSRAWSPGWSNAEKMLEEFVCHGLLDYSKHGMKVGGTTTSLLSPYLHFGEVSVRKVYQLIRSQQIKWENEGKSEATESVNFFLRSIGLREYSRYLCFNFPFTHERSLLGNLKHYPWRVDEDHFKSWRQGMTGYPLVDAGMRELWATGWTHNRIRVIVSSFAVKFLLIPWTWGMKYFWDVLLDADLESDILGWQYISGSLPDGHELRRLDNPEVQGQKYDPDGEYVRTWIPELARMPTEWIHHPWDAPSSILDVAGVELGFNYPMPIVELHTARECLDDAISTMWQLDTAAKLAELDGEVVEDNLSNIKSFDIPKVVLKELSPSASTFDQRVPSTNGKNHKLQPNEVKGSDKHTICVDVIRASKMEDTGSIANSPVLRKRSSSESAYDVPLCSSSIEVHSQNQDPGGSLVGSSRSLLQKSGRKSAGEEEDNASEDSGTSISRPSKRAA